mmetsp:Transcript_12425/g.11032  ORF Transcript_12425/g.11032 Transcript_12425/m.11032 type:complete len:134 (-) Transcript_12425:1117-1518(-)
MTCPLNDTTTLNFNNNNNNQTVTTSPPASSNNVTNVATSPVRCCYHCVCNQRGYFDQQCCFMQDTTTRDLTQNQCFRCSLFSVQTQSTQTTSDAAPKVFKPALAKLSQSRSGEPGEGGISISGWSWSSIILRQ